jgi:PHD/YefM family antitoxin component YafN of YafNO toxin-antitoxin module
VKRTQTQFIVDEKGKQMGVLLSMKAYQRIMEDLEELEAIRAYDAAKASGEKPIRLEEAIARIEKRRR